MNIDYWAIFLIGFLSSFGHCIGMCGGFVTAYSIKLNQSPAATKWSITNLISPHILYNTGRVITYCILGLFFGFIGEALVIVSGIRQFQAGLQFLAGILMILLAIEMGGWLPSNFSNKFPGYSQFKKIAATFLNRVNRRNIFGLGMVLGFIPCGLVYAAGAKAAATGSISEGMLTMMFFGLGTFPAMFAVGLSVNTVSAAFRNRVFKFATILVVVLGILTAYRGIDAFNSPPHIHGNMEMHTNH